MPQIHLNSTMISRIRNLKQTAILNSKHEYFFDDVLLVREQWAKDENDKTLYKADHPELERKVDWKSSVLMFAGDVRLHLVVTYSHKMKISELSDEQVQKLGHLTREALAKEWNTGLAKAERPTLSSRKDPEIYYFEFVLTNPKKYAIL